LIRGLNKITNGAGLGYVMSSYTVHEGGHKAAEEEATEIAAELLMAGLAVFAPIAYSCPIERVMIDNCFPEEERYIKSHEFWMVVDERFYLRCDYGILAMTSNWWKSNGISIELGQMLKAGKPVYFYKPHDARILTIAEVKKEFPDELQELFVLAGKNAPAEYLHANENATIEAGVLAVAENI